MSVSSTFNAADGDGYELMMGRWSRRLAEPFLDFAGTADGERVLDVGCGTGRLAAAIVRRSAPREVTAIDLAQAYIEHARRHNADPRITYEIGDACALRFPAGQFDRVLSLLVLHFVPQSATAIAEMKRVAKPGATIAATVWDGRGGYVANRMFFDTAAALDPEASARRAKHYTRPLTRPGELGAAWRAAGLREVVDTALHIRMEFASFGDYWAPFEGRDGSHAEYMSSLDDARRARLKAAVRAAYLDGDDDGPRSYAATAWAVRGIVPA